MHYHEALFLIQLHILLSTDETSNTKIISVKKMRRLLEHYFSRRLQFLFMFLISITLRIQV